MAEAYKVNNPCTFTPPTPATPTKITMPVSTVNGASTPVTKIVARQGSQTSWEREATPRYADIYFNSSQFNTLKNSVGTSAKVYITYDAPAISGDDRIYSPTVALNYP